MRRRGTAHWGRVPRSNSALAGVKSSRTLPMRLLRESTANLSARTGLTFAFIAVFAAALVSVAVTEADSVMNVETYDDKLVQLGYDTFIISPGQGASMTPSSCLALETVTGVRAAVWVTTPVPDMLFSAGGPAVSVSQVGGTTLKFLGAVDPAAASAWRGQQVLVDDANPVVVADAEGFRLRIAGGLAGAPDPSSGATVSAPIDVRTVRALSARLSSLGQANQGNILIMGVAPPTVAACELYVDQAHRSSVPVAVTAAFPPESGYSDRWVLANAAAFQAPVAAFQARPSQWYWLAGTLLVVLLWGLQLRIRRSEIALYAASGLTTNRLAILCCAEFLIVFTSSLCLGIATFGLSSLVHGSSGGAIAVGLASSLRMVVATVLAGIAVCISVAVSAHTNPFEGLNDR